MSLRMAFQGALGAYSESAARRRWPDLTPVPCREVRDVFAAIRDGRADAGILPIENSLVGSVTHAVDALHEAFSDGALRLTHEVLYPVHHALVAPVGATLEGITRVVSHPVALGQCRTFFESRIPQATLVGAWDTAGSAADVARDGDPTVAAVAAKESAVAHGLTVLAERIEDDPTNQTRFLVIAPVGGGVQPASSGPRKSSLIVCVDHRAGSLAHILFCFGARGVNLSALQSRPEPSAPWSYRFYLDIEGSVEDPRVAEALAEVDALASRIIVLGSYEAWTEGVPAFAPLPPVPAHRTAKPDMPLWDRRRNPEGTRVQVRHVTFGGPRPVLVGGPCSVETREMLLETALSIAEAGADMLRGGAFKPRTSPYEFQGLGVEGLRILAEARELTGMPIVTEVLSWEEVPVVAKFADLLQIGARNMQNFSLLRAAARSGVPVLLKRGAGALVDEWLMAAEYILAEGNPNVILCERGIRTFERATRHTLDLNAVALVREKSHLPIVVDPSHAAGVRSLVPALGLGALAAGACGLLVETHPNPAEAWSDGPQSLDLPAFAAFARLVHPEGRRWPPAATA